MWKDFQEKYSINEKIISVIDEMGFNKITKVQNVVIPNFIKNRDVIVKSCTGSGKTLSYLIPIFQKLLDKLEKEYEIKNFDKDISENPIKNKILAIVFLPTRELAMQVNSILSKFIQKLHFTFQLVMGGTELRRDLDRLNSEIPNIIVATPGRLNDLDEKLNFDFRHLSVLILDEADKMLELGYGKQLTYLLAKFPKQRRTGLFSATINSQIENMIKIGMQNPIFVDIKINLDSNNGKSTNTQKVCNQAEADQAGNLDNSGAAATQENNEAKKKKKKKKKKNKNKEGDNANEPIENNLAGEAKETQDVIASENLEIKETKSASKVEDEILLNEEIFIKSVDEDTSAYSKVIIVDSISDKMEELGNFIQEIPNQLKQFYAGFDNIQDKLPYLIHLIKNYYSKNSKIIVFFATCNCVEYFAIAIPKILAELNDQDFKSKIDGDKLNFFKLHSKITQKKRNLEYKNFLNCQNGILLSTDLSARGIDVPNVDVIIQFDPPKNEEIYIHRVGRTARVGRQGLVN